MENTIPAGVLGQLLRLSPEARRVVAYALLEEEEPKRNQEKHIEQESFYEATNAALELSLRIEQMRAVAESFADDYIDLHGQITTPMAVAHSTDHFNNLFNACFNMIVDIDAQAKKLTHDLDEIWKNA